MVSVEVVRPDHVFVEGDIMRNKYLVRLVKFSGLQRFIEGVVDNRFLIKYNT